MGNSTAFSFLWENPRSCSLGWCIRPPRRASLVDTGYHIELAGCGHYNWQRCSSTLQDYQNPETHSRCYWHRAQFPVYQPSSVHPGAVTYHFGKTLPEISAWTRLDSRLCKDKHYRPHTSITSFNAFRASRWTVDSKEWFEWEDEPSPRPPFSYLPHPVASII